MSALADRVLPHNLEAEKCVLGSILMDGNAFTQATEIIGVGDFFRDAHRRLFDKMVRLSERNQPIDPITLKNELMRSGELDDVGGPAYICALTDGVPQAANIEHYARIVHNKAKLRSVISDASKIMEAAYEGDLEGARAALDASASSSELTEPCPRLIDDVAILDTPDVPYLVDDLVQARSIYAVVGPQGSGKTTIGLCLAYAISNSLVSDFLGRRVIERGPTVYVLLEGQTAVKNRIAAVKFANNLPVDEPGGVFLYLESLDLLDSRSVSRLISAARPLSPAQVVIDTWAMAFTDDENAARDVSRELRAVQLVRDELSCAVGLVHHTNANATRERGSTAFKAGIDTMVMVTAADDAIRLVCEKQRDGAAFPEIPVRLVQIPEAGGAQIVRLASEVVPDGRLTAAQERALSRLREDLIDGASSSEWRATVPEIPERSFYRIQAELVRNGRVIREGSGRSARYRVRSWP